ncbi:hypothetical protein [Bordetella genomosp. 5]|uniref:hypothetical protein n=1 Tax=Bordetella genomosp. 5 TaxID=1395608 RepID=UPI00114032BA|nr:hypothetical protein [Bordetella genomosp. 5]
MTRPAGSFLFQRLTGTVIGSATFETDALKHFIISSDQYSKTYEDYRSYRVCITRFARWMVAAPAPNGIGRGAAKDRSSAAQAAAPLAATASASHVL